MAQNQEIRLNLLDKCFNYLVKTGLENTSLRDLCKGTGISSGSIYYWFGGKDSLFLEATQYGLSVVADNIFEFIFENINNLDYFFEHFLEHINAHRMALRYIYQVATSPIYGAFMNENMLLLNDKYYQYSKRLCVEFGCNEENIKPLIFLFASMISDYAVWGDLPVTKMQLDYLHTLLEKELKIYK